MMAKRIGILTAGSDCPGLNAAIRALGKAASSIGAEVVAFSDGFQGLMQDHVVTTSFSGILTAGGTVLGTSRDTPYSDPVLGERPDDLTVNTDKSDAAVATYQRHNLDALVCIGGHETQSAGLHLAERGLNVITLPSGIDNAISGTDLTIGCDTALGSATDAIDRLHNTASSHHRIILVEIMGRISGWLTLGAGLAGGADVIIIPEIPFDVAKIRAAILERNKVGRRFSIVAVSEGGISKDTVDFFQRSRYANKIRHTGEQQEVVDQRLNHIERGMTGNTIYLANRLEMYTGLETRITILGHILRGGTPSASDRNLATDLGVHAVQLIAGRQFGVMVGTHNRTAVSFPLQEVVGKNKQIPPDHLWLESARKLGTSFGE